MSLFLKNLPRSFFRAIVSSRPIYNKATSLFTSIAVNAKPLSLKAPILSIGRAHARAICFDEDKGRAFVKRYRLYSKKSKQPKPSSGKKAKASAGKDKTVPSGDGSVCCAFSKGDVKCVIDCEKIAGSKRKSKGDDEANAECQDDEEGEASAKKIIPKYKKEESETARSDVKALTGTWVSKKCAKYKFGADKKPQKSEDCKPTKDQPSDLYRQCKEASSKKMAAKKKKSGEVCESKLATLEETCDDKDKAADLAIQQCVDECKKVAEKKSAERKKSEAQPKKKPAAKKEKATKTKQDDATCKPCASKKEAKKKAKEKKAGETKKDKCVDNTKLAITTADKQKACEEDKRSQELIKKLKQELEECKRNKAKTQGKKDADAKKKPSKAAGKSGKNLLKDVCGGMFKQKKAPGKSKSAPVVKKSKQDEGQVKKSKSEDCKSKPKEDQKKAAAKSHPCKPPEQKAKQAKAAESKTKKPCTPEEKASKSKKEKKEEKCAKVPPVKCPPSKKEKTKASDKKKADKVCSGDKKKSEEKKAKAVCDSDKKKQSDAAKKDICKAEQVKKKADDICKTEEEKKVETKDECEDSGPPDQSPIMQCIALCSKKKKPGTGGEGDEEVSQKGDDLPGVKKVEDVECDDQGEIYKKFEPCKEEEEMEMAAIEKECKKEDKAKKECKEKESKKSEQKEDANVVKANSACRKFEFCCPKITEEREECDEVYKEMKEEICEVGKAVCKQKSKKDDLANDDVCKEDEEKKNADDCQERKSKEGLENDEQQCEEVTQNDECKEDDLNKRKEEAMTLEACAEDKQKAVKKAREACVPSPKLDAKLPKPVPQDKDLVGGSTSFFRNIIEAIFGGSKKPKKAKSAPAVKAKGKQSKKVAKISKNKEREECETQKLVSKSDTDCEVKQKHEEKTDECQNEAQEAVEEKKAKKGSVRLTAPCKHRPLHHKCADEEERLSLKEKLDKDEERSNRLKEERETTVCEKVNKGKDEDEPKPMKQLITCSYKSKPQEKAKQKATKRLVTCSFKVIPMAKTEEQKQTLTPDDIAINQCITMCNMKKKANTPQKGKVPPRDKKPCTQDQKVFQKVVDNRKKQENAAKCAVSIPDCEPDKDKKTKAIDCEKLVKPRTRYETCHSYGRKCRERAKAKLAAEKKTEEECKDQKEEASKVDEACEENEASNDETKQTCEEVSKVDEACEENKASNEETKQTCEEVSKTDEDKCLPEADENVEETKCEERKNEAQKDEDPEQKECVEIEPKESEEPQTKINDVCNQTPDGKKEESKVGPSIRKCPKFRNPCPDFQVEKKGGQEQDGLIYPCKCKPTKRDDEKKTADTETEDDCNKTKTEEKCDETEDGKKLLFPCDYEEVRLELQHEMKETQIEEFEEINGDCKSAKKRAKPKTEGKKNADVCKNIETTKKKKREKKVLEDVCKKQTNKNLTEQKNDTDGSRKTDSKLALNTFGAVKSCDSKPNYREIISQLQKEIEECKRCILARNDEMEVKRKKTDSERCKKKTKQSISPKKKKKGDDCVEAKATPSELKPNYTEIICKLKKEIEECKRSISASAKKEDNIKITDDPCTKKLNKKTVGAAKKKNEECREESEAVQGISTKLILSTSCDVRACESIKNSAETISKLKKDIEECKRSTSEERPVCVTSPPLNAKLSKVPEQQKGLLGGSISFFKSIFDTFFPPKQTLKKSKSTQSTKKRPSKEAVKKSKSSDCKVTVKKENEERRKLDECSKTKTKIKEEEKKSLCHKATTDQKKGVNKVPNPCKLPSKQYKEETRKKGNQNICRPKMESKSETTGKKLKTERKDHMSVSSCPTKTSQKDLPSNAVCAQDKAPPKKPKRSCKDQSKNEHVVRLKQIQTQTILPPGVGNYSKTRDKLLVKVDVPPPSKKKKTEAEDEIPDQSPIMQSVALSRLKQMCTKPHTGKGYVPRDKKPFIQDAHVRKLVEFYETKTKKCDEMKEKEDKSNKEEEKVKQFVPCKTEAIKPGIRQPDVYQSGPSKEDKCEEEESKLIFPCQCQKDVSKKQERKHEDQEGRAKMQNKDTTENKMQVEAPPKVEVKRKCKKRTQQPSKTEETKKTEDTSASIEDTDRKEETKANPTENLIGSSSKTEEAQNKLEDLCLSIESFCVRIRKEWEHLQSVKRTALEITQKAKETARKAEQIKETCKVDLCKQTTNEGKQDEAKGTEEEPAAADDSCKGDEQSKDESNVQDAKSVEKGRSNKLIRPCPPLIKKTEDTASDKDSVEEYCLKKLKDLKDRQFESENKQELIKQADTKSEKKKNIKGEHNTKVKNLCLTMTRTYEKKKTETKNQNKLQKKRKEKEEFGEDVVKKLDETNEELSQELKTNKLIYPCSCLATKLGEEAANEESVEDYSLKKLKDIKKRQFESSTDNKHLIYPCLCEEPKSEEKDVEQSKLKNEEEKIKEKRESVDSPAEGAIPERKHKAEEKESVKVGTRKRKIKDEYKNTLNGVKEESRMAMKKRKCPKLRNPCPDFREQTEMQDEKKGDGLIYPCKCKPTKREDEKGTQNKMKDDEKDESKTSADTKVLEAINRKTDPKPETEAEKKNVEHEQKCDDSETKRMIAEIRFLIEEFCSKISRERTPNY